MNKRWLIAAAALAAFTTAQAQDTGNWIVRARAVRLDSANGNTTPVPNLTINNKWLPEVDFTYFFTPNLAAELILTVPQKQTLRVGAADVGTFKHLPPTLTAQYHFTGLGGFRPYLGAGINYTNISDVKLQAAAAALEVNSVNLKRNSFGLALQAGVDIPVGGGWLLNVDVKKVQIRTDVLVDEGAVGKFKVDPVLFGIGIGKRF
jgi:outer membrane protein